MSSEKLEMSSHILTLFAVIPLHICLSVGVSPANRDGVAAYVCGDLYRVVLRSARYNAGIPKPAYLLHTPPVRKYVNDTYR